MRDWREGISLARIRWQDEQGAEHLCAATERAWALEQLAVIEREPGYRLVSCVVETPAEARRLAAEIRAEQAQAAADAELLRKAQAEGW